MKERLIGACILVALAVIFIPMLFEEPDSGATVSSQLELPAAATNVTTYNMSLTRDTPPKPVSPRVAEGGAASPAPSGRIKRPAPTNDARDTVDPIEASAGSNDNSADADESAAPAVPLDVSPDDDARAEDTADAARAGAAKSDSDAGLSGWFVQAGSFLHQNYAKRLTARLKDKGFKAFTLPSESDGKTYYRVRVGPLAGRRAAQQLAPEIAAAAGGPTRVLSEP